MQGKRLYIHRDIENRIFTSFQGSFITAILGPRRVGKSTLVSFYQSQFRDRVWVNLNMDKMVERQRCARGELQMMIQEQALQLIGDNVKLWVIIDESQKCPELFDQIKTIYDEWKDKPNVIKFILTGSGSLSLHELSAETLAGRIDIIYLREFCLREAVSLKNGIEIPRLSPLDVITSELHSLKQIVKTISPFRDKLENALQDYLIWGGLPEVISLNTQSEKMIYLGNYLETYLEKDVRAVKEISNLNLYQKLLEIVAIQTGSVRDDTKILMSLGCARDTLKKYRVYLIATLMYQEIFPYISSTLKRLTKSPKGYLIDNGLISFLTGINQYDILKSTNIIGHRFENWFLHELKTWLDRSIGKNTVYYWRKSSGIEVDFIVEKKPHIFPFEVTFSTKKIEKKLKHLVEFMKSENVTQGFYVYNGPYDYDSKNNIYFLPAWIFC